MQADEKELLSCRGAVVISSFKDMRRPTDSSSPSLEKQKCWIIAGSTKEPESAGAEEFQQAICKESALAQFGLLKALAEPLRLGAPCQDLGNNALTCLCTLPSDPCSSGLVRYLA